MECFYGLYPETTKKLNQINKNNTNAHWCKPVPSPLYSESKIDSGVLILY